MRLTYLENEGNCAAPQGSVWVRRLLLAWLAAAAAEYLLLPEGARDLKGLAALAQIDEDVLLPVLKTTAISILTKITGELCRGGGEGGLASFVETAGTILALWGVLPLAEGVLELMGQLLL